MEKDQLKKAHLIIYGVTNTGETFRPSDWAERLCGRLSHYIDHKKLCYSPMLQPVILNGYKCLFVSFELQEAYPKLYKAILAFAHTNNLKIEKAAQDNDHETEQKSK